VRARCLVVGAAPGGQAWLSAGAACVATWQQSRRVSQRQVSV
jgi:hypothetical protein